MNLIYLITFYNREIKNEYPCYYIGSKVSCHFNGKDIIEDSTGKIYTGSVNSSYSPLYNRLIDQGEYSVKILGETTLDPRRIERLFQLDVKAVSNEKYFNKAYANEKSRISAKGYAPYKNLKTGKIVKLSKNEINEDYVGVRKNCKLSENHLNAIREFQKTYWTKERREKVSIRSKKMFNDRDFALKFKNIMNSPNVKDKIKISKTLYWSKPENRAKASIAASKRNATKEFKDKFRKSKARGTWIFHEQKLKELWIALGKPSYITFRKHAIQHGFNDESYQGAIRSWTNYYANRKPK